MYKLKSKYKGYSFRINGFTVKIEDLTDKQIEDNKLTKFFTKLKKTEDKLIEVESKDKSKDK